jgi:hypothetical protein
VAVVVGAVASVVAVDAAAVLGAALVVLADALVGADEVASDASFDDPSSEPHAVEVSATTAVTASPASSRGEGMDKRAPQVVIRDPRRT